MPREKWKALHGVPGGQGASRLVLFFILEEAESAHIQLMSDMNLEMKHVPHKDDSSYKSTVKARSSGFPHLCVIRHGAFGPSPKIQLLPKEQMALSPEDPFSW